MIFTLRNHLSITSALGAILVGGFLLVFTGSANLPEKERRNLRLDVHRVQLRRTSIPFDLSTATIPVSEIYSGGPPKDGIPAISNPRISSPADASFLKNDDRIIGVAIEGKARAYPVSILNQHEIVNDKLGKTPIAVTYCPLCDSAVVFDRRTSIGELEFGVSGLLYNSNVLMHDRSPTESLWSQMRCEGVSGPGAGQKLKVLPVELTTWAKWLSRNPSTDVISNETGHRLNYKANPYAGYFRQANLMFPAKPINKLLPLKEPVLGIWDEQSAFAISTAAFGRKSRQFEKELNGKKFLIAFDADDQTIRIVSADNGIQWLNSFWFAWYAFRPHTTLVTK